MKLTFSPVRRDDSLVLERQGDISILNGEAFDFTPLGEGDTLPAQAVSSDWIAGPVTRENGVLALTIALPHGFGAPPLPRQSTLLTQDGLVALPGHPETETGS